MTVGVPTFQGKRLAEARLARGLHKKTLATMIGVTGTQITRYEDGLDFPQWPRLAAIAEQLKFPTEFFLADPWSEPLDVIFWRSRAVESKTAREMTEQRMRWLCEAFSFLNEEVDFLPSRNVPSINLPTDFRLIVPAAIEHAAVTIRAQWGLKERPIPDMVLALENAGIPVTCFDFLSDKQDGFCFESGRLGRHFVGINSHCISAARARYDAAHELGHHVLHRYVTAEQSRDPTLHKLMETQANRFAGAFLFPQNAFISEIRVPTLDYFCAMKKKWGMSIGAMVYRAHDLGLIEDMEKKELYQKMTRKGWRGPLREPFDSPEEMPFERPRMLRRGIETVVSSGIFGLDSIQAAMKLPKIEIEQLFGLDSGSLDRGKLINWAEPKRRSLRTTDLETGQIVEFPARRKTN